MTTADLLAFIIGLDVNSLYLNLAKYYLKHVNTQRANKYFILSNVSKRDLWSKDQYHHNTVQQITKACFVFAASENIMVSGNSRNIKASQLLKNINIQELEFMCQIYHYSVQH